MPHQTSQVDQNQIRFAALTTVVLLAVAFVLDSWPLVALVALSQLAGALQLPFAPYRLLYMHGAVRLGLRPHVIADNRAPHRFASLLGALFNAVAVLLLVSGLHVAGWAVVGLVFVLANLNAWLHFCVGCFVYYTLSRLGVPGFSQQPAGIGVK